METKEKKLTIYSSILDLKLSSRATNCLIRAGIHNINTLIYYRINAGKSLQEKNTLQSIYNMGIVTLKEIIDKVHENGFLFIDEENFDQVINMIQKTNDENTNKIDKVLDQLDETSFQKSFNTLNHENKTIQERLKVKQNLLLEYKRLIGLKRELLLRETEVDLELKNQYETLKQLDQKLKKRK